MAKTAAAREIYRALQQRPPQNGAVANTLNNLSQVIGECLRLDPEMTLQRLEALLAIAANEGITNKLLALKLNLSANAANRHVLAALDLRLVEAEVSGADRRQNLLVLTPEGQSFVDRINVLLRASAPPPDS